MSPKQKKIAAKAPPPDKIDAKDFAVLKAEKAKGRGMGLQDEKVKPGKVMKAREGKMFKGYSKVFETGAEHGAKGKQPSTIVGVKPNVGKKVASKIPGRIGKTLGVVSMLVPAAYAAAKQYKDYKSAKNRDKAKVKKYNKGGEGRLRSAYVYDQTKKNVRSEGRTHTTMKDMKETRREEYGAAKDRYPSKKDKLKGVAKRVGSLAPFMPTVSVAKGVYDKLSQSTVRKYNKGGGADTGTAGERRSRLLTAVQRAARRARRTRREGKELGPIGGFGAIPSPKRTPRGGPMRPIPERLSKQDILFTTDKSFLEDMKPPRGPAPGKFKSGTMVKARGCKLGRTRPTKIT